MTLTPRQREVYTILAAYIKKNHYSPTIKELCVMLNVRSSCSVHKQLQALTRAGYIKRERYGRFITLCEVAIGESDGT